MIFELEKVDTAKVDHNLVNDCKEDNTKWFTTALIVFAIFDCLCQIGKLISSWFKKLD